MDPLLAADFFVLRPPLSLSLSFSFHFFFFLGVSSSLSRKKGRREERKLHRRRGERGAREDSFGGKKGRKERSKT